MGSILDAMDAAGLRGPSWSAWRSFWRSVFALGLSPTHLARYRQHTLRDKPPEQQVSEAWCVAGRRAGKSHMAALLALYLGIRFDSSGLSAGELVLLPVVARNRDQARVVFSYLKALCELPAFHPYVHRVLKTSIELRTDVNLEIQAASFRTLRGFTIVGAVLDEISFWAFESDSLNPDTEIVDAIRPGMSTVSNALLFAISSPYARRGELFEVSERYFGVDDPHVLVWNSDTKSMNPTVAAHVIQRAYETDPIAAASEYGTDGKVQFRTDVEAFLDVEAIRAVTVPDRRELPPVRGTKYVGFTDPSGGSHDSFTLAIAHKEDGDRAILDAIRERRPPFSPDSVVADFASLLHSYGLTQVVGDRYGGDWPTERFRFYGISYKASERSKSDIYKELIAPTNAGRIELLDLPILRAQLLGLERRTARGGKDSIDHKPGARDDVSNAAAGALIAALPATRSGGKKLARWSAGRGCGSSYDELPEESSGGDPSRGRVGERDYAPSVASEPEYGSTATAAFKRATGGFTGE